MGARPILIIEDDHDIRETCRQILELEGHRVITAVNGRHGLDLLLGQAPSSDPENPGLILLDLMMPVMNGWEFLKARRENASLLSIPVVVVTAAGQSTGTSTLTSTLKEESVQGLLKKPIELDALLKVVEQYCPPS